MEQVYYHCDKCSINIIDENIRHVTDLEDLKSSVDANCMTYILHHSTCSCNVAIAKKFINIFPCYTVNDRRLDQVYNSKYYDLYGCFEIYESDIIIEHTSEFRFDNVITKKQFYDKVEPGSIIIFKSTLQFVSNHCVDVVLSHNDIDLRLDDTVNQYNNLVLQKFLTINPFNSSRYAYQDLLLDGYYLVERVTMTKPAKK